MAGNPEEDLAAFTAEYADAPAKFGAMTVTVAQAQAAHQLAIAKGWCPADSQDDPARQLYKIAGALQAAGSLLPQHEYLLAEPADGNTGER